MNRYVRPIQFAFEPDVVSVFALASFGASGAPTLSTNNSKGVCQWASNTPVWTGTRTNSSASITAMTSLWGVYNGMAVTGTGIPASTTVTSVNPSAKTLTLSQAATASGSTPLTFSGGQYVITFGSQLSPARLDTYVKLLNLTYSWDAIVNEKAQTATSPSAPAAPFLFLVQNATPFSNQTFIRTGTTDGATGVITAMSSTTGIFPGMAVTGLPGGTDIPASSIVLAVTSTTVTISNNSAVGITNGSLIFTPNNPASVIVQVGYYTSTFAGTALGTHTHDLLLKNAAVADGATTRVNAGANLLGANTGSDITVTGSGANGGIVAASAGTPAGTLSTPTFIAANPASGEILRMGFSLCRSTAI